MPFDKPRPHPLDTGHVVPDLKFTAKFSESSGIDEREILNTLETLLASPEAFIDKGGAGAVYRLSEQKICVKLFHPHKDVERRNTGTNFVAREANITARLNSFEHAGVRSPRCIAYFSTEGTDGRSGIVLEELDAVNLQYVLNGKIDAPEAFFQERFMDAIYAYIESLHDEVGILHGDLFARNIMIDKLTGLPRVIDFGDAIDVNLLAKDDGERRKTVEMSQLDEIDKALDRLTS